MANWEVPQPLDYSATGDDIDSASQKLIAQLEDVYLKLNRLRNMDASAGQSVGDSVANSFKIDTSMSPPALLVRNAANTEYIQVGVLDENWGIVAEAIGAIPGDGNIPKFSLGQEANLPALAQTYEMYFAYDTRKLFIFLTGAWRVFLSLQFEDMLGVADRVIMRTEVDTNGPSKIPRLNSVGQGEFDITGSAHKLGGKNLYLPEIQDGQVLVFNGTRDRWEVAPRDDIHWTDVSTTGEAEKIVQTDSNGMANVNISGNAAKIGNKAIDVNSLAEGDVLAYDSTHGTFVNRQAALIDGNGKINVDTTGNAGKIAGKTIDANNLGNDHALLYDATHQTFVNKKVPTVDSNGVSAIDISGNAAKVAQAAIVVDDLQNGDVLVYRSSNNTFINRKGAFTDENGVVQANVSGSAAKWGGKALLVPGIEDGQILVWSEANQAFINRNQGAIGTGRALAISQDGVALANYNGDAYRAVNIVTPHLRVSAHAYTVGEVCFSNELPYTTYLECTTQGVTGNAEPSYAGVSVGDTVVDGSVVWTVRGFVTTGSGSGSGAVDIDISGNATGIDNIDESETYSVGDIVFDGDASPSTCYICVSGTISESVEGGEGSESVTIESGTGDESVEGGTGEDSTEGGNGNG